MFKTEGTKNKANKEGSITENKDIYDMICKDNIRTEGRP